MTTPELLAIAKSRGKLAYAAKHGDDSYSVSWQPEDGAWRFGRGSTPEEALRNAEESQ